MSAHTPKKKTDLRTILLVSVVTLLVWLMAESRTVRSQPLELAPRIEPGTGSELVARPAPGTVWPESLRIGLSGSTAGLDQVIRSLQGRLPLRMGIEVPAVKGVHEIDLREVLRRMEPLPDAGVSVDDIRPDRLKVEVDAMTDLTLPVRVVPPDGVAFASNGAPRASPPALRIRGPASVIERLRGTEALVRLDAGQIATLVPGRPATVPGLKYELPSDADRWSTRVDPPQVDVLLELRSRTVELTLPAMPVQVLMAPGEVGRWKIALDPGSQDLVGVVVSGPSDQIDRLRSGEIVPTASITLGFDELERGIDSKRADVQGLPPGVRVLPDRDLTVRLKVTRVEQATTPE